MWVRLSECHSITLQNRCASPPRLHCFNHVAFSFSLTLTGPRTYDSVSLKGQREERSERERERESRGGPGSLMWVSSVRASGVGGGSLVPAGFNQGSGDRRCNGAGIAFTALGSSSSRSRCPRCWKRTSLTESREENSKEKSGDVCQPRSHIRVKPRE